MMIRRRLANRGIVAALLIAAAPMAFAQNATVRMVISLQPAHQLPFLPPSIRVEAFNDGPVAVTLPKLFALEVTSQAGNFVATFHNHRRSTGIGEVQDSRLTIPAHGTSTFVFGATLEAPYFFCDRHFAVPGTYQLRLI